LLSPAFSAFKIDEFTYHLQYSLNFGHYLVDIKLGIIIKTSQAHVMVANITKAPRKISRSRNLYL
jgi:hypothetical protein